MCQDIETSNLDEKEKQERLEYAQYIAPLVALTDKKEEEFLQNEISKEEAEQAARFYGKQLGTLRFCQQ